MQKGASFEWDALQVAFDAHLVGHDKDPQAAKDSQKAGAVDDVKYNLPASIYEANIVILALPLDAVHETLEIIAPDLKEGTLVLDTAPAKATVAAWAKQLLPTGRFYVGLTPAINPQYLHGTESGVSAAHADLFDKGLMVVNPLPGTPSNVFELAMELVQLLGASPLLMDTAEADGVAAARGGHFLAVRNRQHDHCREDCGNRKKPLHARPPLEPVLDSELQDAGIAVRGLNPAEVP